VTGYGLDGPGIEYRWGRDFPHLSRPALGTIQPPVQWVPGLSRGVKSGRGVTLTPHPLLVQWSRKGRAIPLLPLWAVWPVQSLSACTRVRFTFTLKGRNPNCQKSVDIICAWYQFLAITVSRYFRYNNSEYTGSFVKSSPCKIWSCTKPNFIHYTLTLRRLMLYIYIYIYIYEAPILDVSRSHTTTQHSR
jgi:hypothetical protein